MTAPQPAPAVTKTEAAKPDVAKALLEEILAEVAERGPRQEPETLLRMTLRSADETVELFRVLHEQSIKKTYPEDWVIFATDAGAKVGYLQDVGCDRVAGLWQIDFSKAHPARDVVGRDLGDGNYVAEVVVEATSRLTGQTMEELGFRSTEGLFSKAWEKAKNDESSVKIERLKADVRKAAIANAHGRIVRGIAGLDQVPLETLKVLLGPDKIKRVRNADFQAGSSGGAGNYASDAQLNLIGREAGKKIAGLKTALPSFDDLKEKLAAACLTGGRSGSASALIGKLKDLKPEEWTIADFEEELGIKLIEEGGEE